MTFQLIISETSAVNDISRKTFLGNRNSFKCGHAKISIQIHSLAIFYNGNWMYNVSGSDH